MTDGEAFRPLTASMGLSARILARPRIAGAIERTVLICSASFDAVLAIADFTEHAIGISRALRRRETDLWSVAVIIGISFEA